MSYPVVPQQGCGRDAYWFAAAGLGIGIILGAAGTISLYLAGKFF